MKELKFGVGIPTGTEGLMYPVPFAKARDNIKISVLAEKLGYDSVWGNDHVSTQHYVRGVFPSPPNYYAPLPVLASIAENTTKLKVATALLVFPFRNPAMIAKEVATVDQLSGGRLILGVGIGAYREEFIAMEGEKAKKIHRGTLLDESLEVVDRLFKEESVTHKGEYYDLQEVQSYPKPLQNPFPFYIGGNSPQGRYRTARFGMGWLPAVLTPQEIKQGVGEIKQYCEEFGRSHEEIDIAPQLSVAIGPTKEKALEKFQKSQLFHHMESLKKSTLKNQDASDYSSRNLIGTPEDVMEIISQYAEAGVNTFSALLFADNSLESFMESMQQFSEDIMAKL